MGEIMRRCALALALSFGLAGCSDDDDGLDITGPEFTAGPGRVYPIQQVSFSSNDGVQVSALFGAAQGSQSLPVVILLHDLGGDKDDWLSGTGAFVELLERNYAVLALDLRGHGNTPLPEDRQVLQLLDLENSFLDVHAALTWLQGQAGVDANRVAVVGSGSGGNVAYVSLGVFPQQIKTGISLSPGLWETTSLEPLVVGAGIDPFGPRSMLFMVGDQDQLQGQDVSLSYADFARNLEALTAEPKDLRVFQNSADHGFELLNNVPEALDLLFLWLENNL
jgi:pimeloyl-ACP methyl ester carboxylesterase